jgi:hypothetical protein
MEITESNAYKKMGERALKNKKDEQALEHFKKRGQYYKTYVPVIYKWYKYASHYLCQALPPCYICD